MTARSIFRSRSARALRWGRVLRWASLAAVLPVLWACNSRSLEQPILMPTRTYMQTFQETLNRQIDILFMIDNSSSMEKSQENLRANFPRFMDVLKKLPDGMPDVHIAVISSDMGAGSASGIIPNCGAADNGVFKSGVGVGAVGCTATGLDANQTYISTTGGNNPVTNFGTNDITQVFQCIAPIGAGGCGYEHQLSSVVRALGADGFQTPPENSGFLRPDAYLGIVLITNEDDCSSPNNDFYTTSPNVLNSQLGPSGNFRCVEFGHRCTPRGGGAAVAPQRMAPNNMVGDTVPYDSCVSAEDQGQLTPVATFAAQVKMLKADPANQILVASIQGPTTPYEIHWKTPSVATDPPWPDPTHSCTAPDTSFADPGVRTQEFVQQFGANGLVSSICEANFGPALSTIATKLSQLIGPKCIVGDIYDKDGDAANGIQPDCSVIDKVPNASGSGTVDTRVEACADNGNTAPCWNLVAPGTMNCPANSHVVQINRGNTTPPNNLKNTVACSICIPGFPDPAHGCP